MFLISLKIFECALKEVFPTAHVLESEVTVEGFYCQALIPPFPEEEALRLLEEKVKEIVKSDFPIKTMEMMRENGVNYLKHHKQPQFADKVSEWPENTIWIAEFQRYSFPLFNATIETSTGAGGAIKILHLEKQADRVEFRVVVRENAQDLKRWVKQWKGGIDPSLIGQEMELFTFVNKIPLWKSKGIFLRDAIQKVFNDILDNSPYQAVLSLDSSPQILQNYYLSAPSLKSSHLREWVLSERGEAACFGLLDTTPFMRLGLQGFLTTQQVESELISSLQFFDKIFKIFGFEGQWNLAVDRAAHAKASRTDWERAVKWLAGALEARGVSFSKDARHPQTWITALEGPALEAYVVDRLDRKWLVASLGIDLSFSAGHPNHHSRSTLLKGAVAESLERIIALLLECKQGVLPWEWTPEQIRVVSVGQQYGDYVAEVHAKCVQAGFRATLDCTENKLGAKVHAAQLERIPYVVIVGDREFKNGQITVRSYEPQENVAPDGTSFRLDDFLSLVGNVSCR